MASYTSNDIQTLQFPENIRAVPGMYIGAVDSDGYWLILRECLDNGLDEYLAGRNKGVALVEDQDGSFWIYDQGAGIPQGTKVLNLHVNGKLVQSKMPTMQAIFSELHTSGKYHSEAYKVSVGTHGVGVKSSNALSEYFEVFTRYKNQWFTIGFKKGNLSQPVKACAAPVFLGKTLLKGTLIHLKHDKSIFKKDVRLDFEKAKSWAEITSYLNPGFSVIIKDKEGNSYKYFSKEGPKEFVSKTLEKLKAQAEPEVFEFKNELADVLVSFSNAEGNNIHGYTNGLFNSDGGKHVDSVSSALYLACKQFAKAKQTVSAYDFKEGLVGIVNMHLHKAEFSSQDKLKLTDNRAGADFQKMLETAAIAFFKKNKVLAQKLCEKASKLSELRSQFKASKKMISAINAAKKKGMPAKYAPYSANSKLEDRELLIVEGLSAAGGLRQVRNSNQALYPIKGKITNLIKNKDKGLESEEVINILSAIGYDPKAENPMSKLQVGRVICLADADDDGPVCANTNVLLCDGTTKTIGQLAKQWQKNQKPIWVWSLDSEGNIHPAQAIEPRITCFKNKYAIVHFDDGTKIKCTLNHKFAVNYAYTSKVIEDMHGIKFVAAKNLKPGDSIMSAYFADYPLNGNKGKKKLYKHILSDKPFENNRKYYPLHKIVARDIYQEEYKTYISKNKVNKNSMAIHHKDHNQLNNSPDNLEIISAYSHTKDHHSFNKSGYNGSKLQKQKLKEYHQSSKYLTEELPKVKQRRIEYNKSEQNRLSTAALNKREDIKQLQTMSKLAKKYLLVKDLYKEVTLKSWAITKTASSTYSFISKELLPLVEAHIKNYAITVKATLKCTIDYDNVINDVQIRCAINKFIKVCKTIKAINGFVNEDLYNKEKTNRNISWKVAIGYLETVGKIDSEKDINAYIESELMNHKVVKVEIKEFNEPKPFYCLTVPKYGNFLLADKNGNGICSSNCHINTLLLSLFYKVLPEMFEKGMIYVADMPEFYTTYKNTIITGQSITEIKTKLLELGHKPTANDTYYHLKGWGELENSLMKLLAVDKATRKLIRIKPITDHDNVTFVRIMNEDVAYRRQMLGLSEDV